MVEDNIKKYVIISIILKIVLCIVAVPNKAMIGYISFIDMFLFGKQNPWQYIYIIGSTGNLFPYPPLMLYILAVFRFISYITGIRLELIIMIPFLIADFIILKVLLMYFPKKQKDVVIYYFFSPIILFSVYFNLQLDLIPISILFLSIYLLIMRKHILSAVVFGIAFAIKLPVLVALPISLVYLFRNQYKKKIMQYILVSFGINFIFNLPFVFTEGYQKLVLFSSEQQQLYKAIFRMGDLSIYLAPLVLVVVYIRFIGYKKINNDLLFSYLGLIFSIFILLIPPMPNWYLWSGLFISIFTIRFSQEKATIKYLYCLLSLIYLIYFTIFNQDNSKLIDVFSLNNINKIDSYRNFCFTMLEAILLTIIYYLYSFGVKSNLYYKRYEAIAIGIGGDSGVGKSTLMNAIEGILGKSNIIVLEGDGDHKWERGNKNWVKYTHLDPRANYLHRQAGQIKVLKQRKVISRVDYDHDTGKFTKPQIIKPNDFIIIAGLHPFYLPMMRRMIDLKIYLDTDEKLRQHWKIIRDVKSRGYTLDKIKKQIEERLVDAEKYIYPQKDFANLIIRYYVDEEFEVGNKDVNPIIKLKLTFDASIEIEYMLHVFSNEGYNFEYDYVNDLKNQYIILDKPVSEEVLENCLIEMIPNYVEINRGIKIQWQQGYGAFIQFMILYMASYYMKGIEP